MGQRILSLLVVSLCLVISIPSSAYADENPSLSGFTCSKGGFFSDEFNDEVNRYKEDDANMAEKFMTSQLQNLWNIGDVNGLSTLIFGNPYCVWADSAFTDESTIVMSPDGIFTAVEREKIINPALKMFSGVYVALMALAMMISGLKLGFNSVRGRGISEFGEDGKMWGISLLFIAAYGIITNLIFELNAAVVLSFKGLLEQQGVSSESFSIMATWGDLIGIGSGGIPILSLLIVVLAEWILAIILNFVYIARKVIVIVLLIFGYAAAYSLLFARTRAFFGTWMRELLGNVFLQSIHALLLFGMAMFASLGASTIYKLGLMMMFIPLTGMISKWLKIGDSSTKMGSALTMIGLGGVMSTWALTSQAGNMIRGGNINGGSSSLLSSNFANSDSSFGGMNIATAGGGSDSSITSITTDASGASSDSWMNAKNSLSNIGGAIFGTAGMVAGPAGAMLGGRVGKAVTSSLIQAPRNIASGANSVLNTLSNAKSFNDGAGNTGFKAMMGNLGKRRSFYGNMGESLGVMTGLGGVGRNIGLAMSGVSRQRLMATSVADGGRGMITDSSGRVLPTTMDSLAKQYPGANMQYVQTNKGSSMWVQTPNQDWQQVGLTGAADPLLNNGEARVMDYQLASANAAFELQPNGSYKARRNDSFVMDTSNPLTTGKATTTPFIPTSSPAMHGVNINTPLSPSISQGNIALSRLTTLTGSGNPAMPLVHGNSAVSRMTTLPGSSNPVSLSISQGNTAVSSLTALTGSGNQAMPSVHGNSAVSHSNPTVFNSLPAQGNSVVSRMTTLGDSAESVSMNTPKSVSMNGNPLSPSVIPSSVNQVSQGNPVSHQTTNAQMGTASVGLPGSTPHVMRMSNAYTVGVGGDGTISQDTLRSVNSVNATRLTDPSFKAERINPDAFVAHHLPGVDLRTSGDRVADQMNGVHQTTSQAKARVKKSWSKAVQEGKKERSTRIS